MIKRGIALCTYNRPEQLSKIIPAIFDTVPAYTKLIICDDGSDIVPRSSHFVTISGPNKGVIANKNRALWALQDCHYLCILEDDLMPTEKGWFEIYEEVSALTNNHHFCRVQDREMIESIPEFSEYLRAKNYTPVYGPSPRGDLTFLTQKVIKQVGAFNPLFKGAGHGHGNWSNRVWKAGLISHPLRWWDVKEARDKFIQIGDREGGRWEEDPNKIQEQIRNNKIVSKKLKPNLEVYHPLCLE